MIEESYFFVSFTKAHNFIDGNCNWKREQEEVI